jgi:flagellar M-ring protein FliF
MENWIWLMSRGALTIAIVVVLLVAILRPVLKPLPVQTRSAEKKESTSTVLLQHVAPAGDSVSESVPAQPVTEPAAAVDSAAPETAAFEQPPAEQMAEGESIEQFRDRLRQAAAQNKPTITADMLNMANSYDDKVALMRLLVGENSSRVANALKKMMRE